MTDQPTPKSHKPKVEQRPTYVATLPCGHKALVTDLQKPVTCFVCHLTGVPKKVKTFHPEAYTKFVPVKESED